MEKRARATESPGARTRSIRAMQLVVGPPLGRFLLVPRRQDVSLDRGIAQGGEVLFEFRHVVIELVADANVPCAATETGCRLVDQRNNRARAQFAVFTFDHGGVDMAQINNRIRFDFHGFMKRRKEHAMEREYAALSGDTAHDVFAGRKRKPDKIVIAGVARRGRLIVEFEIEAVGTAIRSAALHVDDDRTRLIARVIGVAQRDGHERVGVFGRIDGAHGRGRRHRCNCCTARGQQRAGNGESGEDFFHLEWGFGLLAFLSGR